MFINCRRLMYIKTSKNVAAGNYRCQNTHSQPKSCQLECIVKFYSLIKFEKASIAIPS